VSQGLWCAHAQYDSSVQVPGENVVCLSRSTRNRYMFIGIQSLALWHTTPSITACSHLSAGTTPDH
jgi:hypothetical protein